ncbi:MAG: radical SAM protein [Clostridia bacterium]|nr:radical SAM protein [Clostridia bacterium]
MSPKTVMLVAFYNKKALGVRYLETALHAAGYAVRTVFFKDFNSVSPKKATEKELALLREDIQAHSPVMVALSVMSSMYLEVVDQVITTVRENFDIPIVCGGAFATLSPEYFLDCGVPFVIRSDGERAIVRLADALANGTSYAEIPCLCYKAGEEICKNEIGDIPNDIDQYGLPTVNCEKACFIDSDELTEGDPQLSTLSYEVIASRGCPFTCSYCSCSNLRKLLPKGVKGVRTRSVKSVIDELIEAKKQCKNIVFVHFYDEIFPNLPGWVDEFVVQYKKHINLPFTIWSHPKMIEPKVLKKLVSVGLCEVIMGIQSGSERILAEVFHRYEKQADIIEATKIIKESGVFWRSYDLMLGHPFETLDDLKESYYLTKKLHGPFELQLHGLNFLPKTDIVGMALDAGYYTEKEMNKIMFAPMSEQFGAYWQRDSAPENAIWYKMIYCLQFSSLRGKIERFENDPRQHADEIAAMYQKAKKMVRIRYIYKKTRIVIKRVRLSLFR